MWESIRERWETFTKEQKLSVCILGVCGLLAVGLSVNRLHESVREPFLVDKDSVLATKKLVGASLAEEEARLRRIDTDGDGLSDYDEVNTFHTNANLRDTCGDNIPDNIRVATGKNINCDGQQANPSGLIDVSGVIQTSSSVLGTGRVDLTPPQPIGLDTAGLLEAAGAAATLDGEESTEIDDILPRDPDAIRQALVGRVDAAKLEKLSDEELLTMYDQAVVQFSTSSSTQP